MSSWVLPALLLGCALILGLTLWLWRDLGRSERLSRRLHMARHSVMAIEPETGDSLPTLLRLVTALGETIARSGVLSSRTLEDLRQTLHIAGFRGAHGLGLFVGTKLLLVLGLPMIALFLAWLFGLALPFPALILGGFAGIGLLAPDMTVQHLRKRYLTALEAGMPDALDMMVICGQAGLGLEASVERVGIEIAHAHPVVAEELTRTAHEMQVSADTRIALSNFGRRTGLESARRLAGMLIQSIQYGTPLSVALRSLSAEQRQEMLSRFEARASRLPVLLTLPMIVFILPCVFLVVAGPAIVDVYRAMSQ